MKTEEKKTEKNTVLIVTSFVDGAEALPAEALDAASFDAVICADGGLKWAKRLGIPLSEKKTTLIGDYDSMEQPVAEKGTLILLPREKDMTDTEAALDLALRSGYKEIRILGGLGGRFDHSMGNIGLLCKAMETGASVTMEDGYNKVFLLKPGNYTLEKGRFTYFSLIAYGGPVTGLSLSGAKYWLHNHTLPYDTTLGVSNEVEEGYDAAEISFQEGILLVIQSNDTK